MREKEVWVLVADEAIARLLRRSDASGELEPVEELTDPAAHARGADLRTDAHGRRAGGAGGSPAAQGGSGATASAGHSEEHQEAVTFARRVAQRLADVRRRRRFDELRVVAAPRFLGLLRKALTPQVAALVTHEIDKDLIHLGNREITVHVFAGTAKE